jgi:hypothetical protein
MPPTIVQEDYVSGDSSFVFDPATAEYVYPTVDGIELNLRPDSDLHKKIAEKLRERALAAHRHMKKRHPRWREIDKTLVGYIEQDKDEKEEKKRDPRRPTSIVVPLTSAILDIILTYVTNAIVQLPYFRYRPTGPEDAIGVALLENLIENHCARFRVGLQLHTVIRDALAYGLGIASPVWEKQYGRRPQIIEGAPIVDAAGKIIGQQPPTRGSGPEEVIYEGGRLENINPYNFLPDPNIPIQDIQKMEFVGWMAQSNRVTALRQERDPADGWFNARYLAKIDGRSSLMTEGKPRKDFTLRTDGDRDARWDAVKPLDDLHMFVDLIPKDWGLGTGEAPQKWVFCLSGDQIIRRAKPVNLDHGLYPVCGAAPNFDGYSLAPTSNVELIQGLQTIADFLMNSHMLAVRKAVNDKIVVDPQLIDVEALTQPDSGWIIPLRAGAWGTNSMAQAFAQLKITDVTQANIPDLANVMNISKEVTGATDILAGIARKTSERVSAAEVENSKGGALARVERLVKVIGLMFMRDAGYMFASHAQQLMSKDTFVKITGRYEDVLRGQYPQGQFAPVSAFDILNTQYDVMEEDQYSFRGESVSDLNQLLQTITTSPILSQQYDARRMVERIAWMKGIRNMSDYRIQIVPDQVALQQAAAGNIVPIQPGPGGPIQ